MREHYLSVISCKFFSLPIIRCQTKKVQEDQYDNSKYLLFLKTIPNLSLMKIYYHADTIIFSTLLKGLRGS